MLEVQELKALGIRTTNSSFYPVAEICRRVTPVTALVAHEWLSMLGIFVESIFSSFRPVLENTSPITEAI